MTDDYDYDDHLKLSFMLGEYLGMQSNRLDKESIQMLNTEVGRILRRLEKMAYVNEKSEKK